MRIGFEQGLGAANQARAFRRVLDLQQIEACTGPQQNLDKTVAEVPMAGFADMVFDQAQRGACAELDDAAQLPGQVGRGAGTHDDQMHERLDHDARGDADHRAVRGQHRVEPGEHVGRVGMDSIEESAQAVRIVPQFLR